MKSPKLLILAGFTAFAQLSFLNATLAGQVEIAPEVFVDTSQVKITSDPDFPFCSFINPIDSNIQPLPTVEVLKNTLGTEVRFQVVKGTTMICQYDATTSMPARVGVSGLLQTDVSLNGVFFQAGGKTRLVFEIPQAPSTMATALSVDGIAARDMVVDGLPILAGDTIRDLTSERLLAFLFSTPRNFQGFPIRGVYYNRKLQQIEGLFTAEGATYNGVEIDDSGNVLFIDGKLRFFEPKYGLIQLIGPVLTDSNFGSLRPGTILHPNGQFARVRTIFSSNGLIPEQDAEFLPPAAVVPKPLEAVYFFNSLGMEVAVCVETSNYAQTFFTVKSENGVKNFTPLTNVPEAIQNGCDLGAVEYNDAKIRSLANDLSLLLDGMEN